MWLYIAIILMAYWASHIYYRVVVTKSFLKPTIIRAVQKLQLYPYIMVLCWIVIAVCRILQFGQKITLTQQYLEYLAFIPAILQGLLVTVVFYVTNSDVTGCWYCLLFPERAARMGFRSSISRSTKGMSASIDMLDIAAEAGRSSHSTRVTSTARSSSTDNPIARGMFNPAEETAGTGTGAGAGMEDQSGSRQVSREGEGVTRTQYYVQDEEDDFIDNVHYEIDRTSRFTFLQYTPSNNVRPSEAANVHVVNPVLSYTI